MAKNQVKISANVVDTARPRVAGAGKRPAVDALRSLVSRVTAPLLPDDYLKLANPLWSARELRGRVVEVRRETEDSATLVIKPGWGFTFDYRPGQYIGIGLLVEGRWRWRSYSLTSSPTAGAAGSATSRRGSRTIAITVKAMPEGFLSTHLVGGVAPGTIVRLAAPQGNFVMPDPAPASVLFLTAGSGITPVMSMLRTLARRDQIGDIVHVHSAPTDADVMFAAELAELGRSHDGYRLTVRTTRAQGRLDLQRLDAEVSDWRDRQTWACGPEGMLNEAQKLWAAAGLADQLHLERFAASRAGVHGTGGTVTFERSGRSVVADAATSLMDAGEQAGVPHAFRLPDGHLSIVRGEPGRRPCSRLAHWRRARTGYSGTNLHFGCVG